MTTKPRVHDLAFTGTQVGMTESQYYAVDQLLYEFKPVRGRHGDCIGADAEFHKLCMEHQIGLVIHPPEDSKKRAWSKGAIYTQAARRYLTRNRLMVEQSDLLIATPRQAEEVVRSGTWATIRHARRIGKPLIIVYPDGTSTREFPAARVDAGASGHPGSGRQDGQPE